MIQNEHLYELRHLYVRLKIQPNYVESCHKNFDVVLLIGQWWRPFDVHRSIEHSLAIRIFRFPILCNYVDRRPL